MIGYKRQRLCLYWFHNKNQSLMWTNWFCSPVYGQSKGHCKDVAFEVECFIVLLQKPLSSMAHWLTLRDCDGYYSLLHHNKIQEFFGRWKGNGGQSQNLEIPVVKSTPPWKFHLAVYAREETRFERLISPDMSTA